MKKIVCVIFTMIILTGSVSAAFGETGSAGKSFSDVKSTNWAYESVNAMSQKGILAGYPDGTFKPNSTVTYGQFIKMALIGATKEDIGNSSTGNWAEGYYNKALELQYFSQASIDKSKINNNIPRGDMALIISNILGDTKIENYDTLEQGFSDVDSTTKNDYDIIKSYASGILTGYEDGTFKPNGTLTRAEAVTVIYRLVDESKRVKPGTTTITTTPAVSKVNITFKGTTSSSTFEKTLVTTKLGEYGIKKFEITSNGYVAIYSTEKYAGIRLIIDNVVTAGFGNPDGTNYWVKDGYYVYYAEPSKTGISVKGKTPTLMVDDSDNVYKFADITL